MNKINAALKRQKSLINLWKQRLQLEITFNLLARNAVQFLLLTKRSTEKHICMKKRDLGEALNDTLTIQGIAGT